LERTLVKVGRIPVLQSRFGQEKESKATRLKNLGEETFGNLFLVAGALMFMGGIGNVGVKEYLDLRNRADYFTGRGGPAPVVMGRNHVEDFADGIMKGSLAAVLSTMWFGIRHTKKAQKIVDEPETPAEAPNKPPTG
jgi:hypothetical protein